MSVRDALGDLGLPSGDLHDLPTSEKRFPDGAQYRIEIPSTEGPACLDAVLAEAENVEVSLFARPNAGWDASATARAPAGAALAAAARGQDQLVAVLEDVVRASEHGIRSVLLADVGALYAFSRLRAEGVLPAEMQAKVSVMLP